MKIVKQIPAYLLAFVFVFGGAVYFLKAMPTPASMSANEQSFMTLFASTGYLDFIKVLEIAFGVLLIFPKTRAIGFILIAPIVVNIFCYDIFISKHVGLGIVLIIVNALGIYFNKKKYASLI